MSGTGTVRVGDDTFKASLGSRFFINKKQIHRATADKDSHLVFVEVQLGDCNENDIVRLEDQYGRCLLYTSPSPRDKRQSRMPSSA